jgi:hypothetical protein
MYTICGFSTIRYDESKNLLPLTMPCEARSLFGEFSGGSRVNLSLRPCVRQKVDKDCFGGSRHVGVASLKDSVGLKDR